MLYLSSTLSQGVTLSRALEHRDMLGLMLQPHNGVRLRLASLVRHWAVDNGCFSAGDRFDLNKYLGWLEKMSDYRDKCLFATAPDVVGDASATLERSLPVLPLIRELGYKAALVGQDGLEHLPIDWHLFDAFFTGGSTEWKLSEAAYALATEARQRGKWVHMGRVNSYKRYRAAALGGYQSADGTQLCFAPDRRLMQVIRWFEQIKQEPGLPLW